jgi:predicted DNA-binding transcriptional regulator AlpA
MVDRVAPLVDPDDLIDAHVVADLLGLAQRSSVATYRKRHADFPEPVIDMGVGRCLLWLRADVVAWRDGRA